MAPGRQIACCLCLLLAGAALLGCGSDEPANAEIPATAAADLTSKLSQIEERAAAGDCTGNNSAMSSLDSLREAIEGDLLAGADEQFRADLTEMLDRLEEQLAGDCEEAEPTTSSTTTEVPTTSTPTTTVPPETTTTTTSTTEKTTTTTKTTPSPPQGNGPSGNGPPGHDDDDDDGPSGGSGGSGGVGAGDRRSGASEGAGRGRASAGLSGPGAKEGGSR